jgi:hypothetical protein
MGAWAKNIYLKLAPNGTCITVRWGLKAPNHHIDTKLN